MAGVIRTVIHGATGNMGREVLTALAGTSDLQAVGAVSRSGPDRLPLPGKTTATIPCARSLEDIFQHVEATTVADFTSREGALAAARACARRGIHLVTGTSGLSPQDVEEMDRLARGAGTSTIIAPNFAIGSVLLMHLSKIAAQHFETVEVIEMHHARKKDAPSGTAIATARALVEARDGKPFVHPNPETEPLPGSRGGELGGVGIHAIRLPGLLAHQEVIFGALGQTLTLRHDTITRECYMPGVLLALRKVGETRGVTYGLDKLLGLT